MKNLIPVYLLSSVLCSALDDGSPRIITGNEAKKGQFPWQAAIFTADDENFRCSGALINDKWILTAAKCVAKGSYIYRKVYIALNSTYSKGLDPDRILIDSDLIIPHEQYNEKTGVNDIALIKLAQPVKLTKHIKPLDLIQKQTNVGTTVTIIGWGRLSAGFPFPTPILKNLHYGFLVTISDGKCSNAHRPNGTFCVEQNSTTQIPCMLVTAGSPVVLNNKSTLVGILSYHASYWSCQSSSPLVITDASAYIQWIKEKTGI